MADIDADKLAGAIFDMYERDRGLSRGRLKELIEDHTKMANTAKPNTQYVERLRDAAGKREQEYYAKQQKSFDEYAAKIDAHNCGKKEDRSFLEELNKIHEKTVEDRKNNRNREFIVNDEAADMIRKHLKEKK